MKQKKVKYPKILEESVNTISLERFAKRTISSNLSELCFENGRKLGISKNIICHKSNQHPLSKKRYFTSFQAHLTPFNCRINHKSNSPFGKSIKIVFNTSSRLMTKATFKGIKISLPSRVKIAISCCGNSTTSSISPTKLSPSMIL